MPVAGAACFQAGPRGRALCPAPLRLGTLQEGRFCFGVVEPLPPGSSAVPTYPCIGALVLLGGKAPRDGGPEPTTVLGSAELWAASRGGVLGGGPGAASGTVAFVL